MATFLNGGEQGEVRIQQYSDSSECDVIVLFRGREMIVQLPDYSRAVKCARMESKNCATALEISID